MKNYSGYIHFLLLPFLISVHQLSGQVIGAAAFNAIPVNGKIAVQVNAAAYNNFNAYFVGNANGEVSADFYFQPDDPRNGTYTSVPAPVAGGGANMVFYGLDYQNPQDLSFDMITHVGGGGIREYIFIEGNYFPPSPPGEIPCPASIYMHQQGWRVFRFNTSDFIVSSNNLPATVNLYFGAGNPANGTYNITPAPGPTNGFYLPNNNANLGNGVPPVSMLIIDGHVCQYQNGQLISNPSCSPWSDAYDGFEDCAMYFEMCTPTLLSLLLEHKDDIACSQWSSITACSSTAKINRSGKLAIGTSGFSSSTLTVKGGVITDKVKVQTCTAGGWCDYVFDEGYPLMPLDAVKAYIQENRHLPGIPSGAVLEAEGSFELGEITYMHQEKIEEIFLHLIRLEKEISQLESALAFSQYMEKSRVK